MLTDAMDSAGVVSTPELPRTPVKGGLVKELLPFCAGLAVGGGLAFVRPMVRWLALPGLCVALGALMSWVNGELGSSLWPVFVSLDALLVWAGAVLALAAIAARRRIG